MPSSLCATQASSLCHSNALRSRIDNASQQRKSAAAAAADELTAVAGVEPGITVSQVQAYSSAPSSAAAGAGAGLAAADCLGDVGRMEKVLPLVDVGMGEQQPTLTKRGLVLEVRHYTLCVPGP